MSGLVAAAADLLLAGSCVGCGRPGLPLCEGCRQELPRAAVTAWPTPTPAGLATPWAAAAYDGTVRAMVLALKERRTLALARPLGDLVALSVRAALGEAADGPALLVPVPSRAATRRARGHDPTTAIASRAAKVLRGEGLEVTTVQMLRLTRRTHDQSVLGAQARADNLAGSMACPAQRLAAVARRVPRAHVVVCDDVLTTGATACEAQRALEGSGVAVRAIAVAAATRRRL